MVEINWTKQAVKDIDNIAEFIAKDSEHYAQIQVQRLLLSVKPLERFPKRGKVVPEKQDPSIREVLVGSYRVIYRIVSKTRIDMPFITANDYLKTALPSKQNDHFFLAWVS